MIRRLIRLMPYARRRWATLTAIGLMTVIASATTLLQPWPIKLLVDYALGDVEPPQWLVAGLGAISLEVTPVLLVLLAGAATLVLYTLGLALDVALSWAWMAAGQRMVYDLTADLFARLQRLSLSFHRRHRVGDFLDRLTADTWCVYSIASDLLVSPFQQTITLVGIGVVAWLLDPWLTMLSFGMAPVLAISVHYYGPRLKRRAKRSREAQSRLTQFVHQTITSIPLVQAFSTEQRNQDQFDELVDQAVAASQHGVLVNRSFALVNGLTNSLGRAIVILAGGLQVLAGAMSVGSLLVFLAYIHRLQTAWQQLLRTYAKLKTSEASLDRLFEVLEAGDGVSEVRNARPVPERGPRLGVHVAVESVTFAYEPGLPVLKEVSFEALPGEKIALVGPTGAGKSTLISLIPRFFDPWQGRILFDGMDIREMKLDSLRRQIALVLQEPFLLPLTVAENIAYGCPEASREQVVEAAEVANARSFIEQLPAGYDTVIGERGSTLSGGQKQRIAIARALMRNAPVVVLDEPTSALDTKTEADLLEALNRLTLGRTTILVAHRLSTIHDANRIVVLEQGQVVETGNHDQLIANRGLYARFHAAQLEQSAEVVTL